MDGTGMKIVSSKGGPDESLAVDYHASRLYFMPEFDTNPVLTEYDVQRINSRWALNLPALPYPQKFHVAGNVVFWQENPGLNPSIFRAEVHKRTEQFLMTTRQAQGLRSIQVLPPRSGFEATPLIIPCEGSYCSHVCVRSSRTNYTCLCSEGYILHEDGHTCNSKSLPKAVPFFLKRH